MSKSERREENSSIVEFLRNRVKKESDSFSEKRNHKTVTTFAREQLFLEQLQAVLKETFRGKVVIPKHQPKKVRGKTERILNVSFSDIHFGAALDIEEVGRRYSAIEEGRRVAAVVRQVADYKRQYRNETELFVHLVGDIIQGQLHDMRDGQPLTAQIGAAVHVLLRALGYLAAEFPRGVTVFCTPGNHGRFTSRHKERAVNQKWDAIETVIYIALREALRGHSNVKFVIPKTPYYTYMAFDKKGFVTHGDTVLNPGYPSRSINVGGIKNQVNSINAAAGKDGGQEYDLFLVGHVHVGSMTHLPGGAVFLTNGCLIPPDAFAVSIGQMDCTCGQWLWESVIGHIVGDARFVEVGAATDVDETLDLIIPTYKGL